MFEHDKGTRYEMRQKMISIGDDYWIKDDHGNKVYKVDGKALALRKTLVFEDTNGHEVCKIQQKLLHITKTMAVEGPNGETLATVHKALINLLGERWVIKMHGRDEAHVHGNILNHDYTIGKGDHKIAEVSKKWFALTDTYGVQVEPGQNDVAVLAVTVIIDEMAHGDRQDAPPADTR